jgi:lipopolysaccharide export system protein LptA
VPLPLRVAARLLDRPAAARRRAEGGASNLCRRLDADVLSALLKGAIIFVASFAAASPAPALAEKAQAVAVIPGGDAKEPINIDAAKLDYFDKEQKLVYTGNVIATQGDGKLKASTLILYLTPKEGAGDQPGAPSPSSQLRRMEASGPVTLVSKDQIGTGDSGIYEKSENKVYLIGNVTLTQGPNVTKGDKLIYDLTTKQAVVTGRVKSMFIPSGGAESAGEAANRKKPEKKP